GRPKLAGCGEYAYWDLILQAPEVTTRLSFTMALGDHGEILY
ncbi:hypothetical protein A2U01_0101155, partial [Trifolium medium]|nr:hypothetical protein [Trifolium medium]